MSATDKLNAVLKHIKETFVGKNEIIDLLGIGLLAKENAFLLGPPGTAKSAIIRALSNGIDGGKNLEYLLTRFTEPNEIFGPFDILAVNDSLKGLYLNRIVERKAVKFAEPDFIKRQLEIGFGDYKKVFWPQL